MTLMLNQHADATNYTGSAGILRWKTPNYLRFTDTSPSTVISLDVEVATNKDPEGNDGFHRVYVEVRANGEPSPSTWLQKRGEELRSPDFAAYQSPVSEDYAPLKYWGFGFDLDLSTQPAGYLDLRIRTQTKAGNYGESEYLRIYNDTDGIDRRPRPNELFVNEDTGTPTGSGGFNDPVDTIQAAVALLINPVATVANRNLGGAVINVTSNITGMGGDPGSLEWHTTGQVLKIRSHGGRYTFRTATHGVRVDSDKLFGGCYSALETNVQFENFHIVGMGFFVDKTGHATGPINLIDIDCSSTSSTWISGQTSPSVNCTMDDSQPVETSEYTTTTKQSWGHHRYGTAQGLLGYSDLHDFKIEYPLEEALDLTHDEFCFSGGIIRGMRTNQGGILGWFNVNGGEDLDITQIGTADIFVVQATSTSVLDFVPSYGHLVGSADWGIQISGATNAGNNVSVATVLGVGYDPQGLPYVILAYSGGMSETMTSSGRLRTARLSDGVVFPTAISAKMLTSKAAIDGGIISTLRFEDCPDVAGFDFSGYSLNRFAMKNVADGSLETGLTNAHNFASPTTFTHVMLENISLSSPDITWGTASDTGSYALDCVFGFGPATTIMATGYIAGCHWVTGTAHGIAPSTGSWFSSDPGASPYSATPLDVGMNQGVSNFLQYHHWTHTKNRPQLSDWVSS